MRRHQPFALPLLILLIAPAWAGPKRLVKVETTPPDALVSVHKSEKPERGAPRTVAGATPLTKEFDFGKARRLWLEFEKRGYATRVVEITPDKDTVSVALDRIENGGTPAPEYSTPAIHRIAVAAEAQVFHHGFTKETKSPEESRAAAESLASAVRAALEGKNEAVLVGGDTQDTEALGPIWRDIHGIFELIDPIRLRYLPPSSLETRSARDSAQRISSRTGADALLLVSLRQTAETTAMVIGKSAITAGGTAASYSAGYANAVTNQQSFFVYTVFLPAFAQGAVINSVLIDCRTGEILWANRGTWNPLNFEKSEQLKGVATDLLTGLP